MMPSTRCYHLTLVCLLVAASPILASSEGKNETEHFASKITRNSKSLRAQMRLTESKEKARHPKRDFNTRNLSDLAVRMTGDSSFARRLKEQEEDEDEEKNLQRKKFQSQSTSSAVTSSILFGGMGLVGLIALHLHGSTTLVQEIVSGWASALAFAWLPTLFLRSSWFEILSLASLLLRPSIRNYARHELLPAMWLSLRKMVLGESWRWVWTVVLAPFPKQLFVPGKAEYSDFPPWLQRGLEHCNGVIDKFTQSLIRKSVQQSIHGTIGIFYESVANSMLEISILYDEASSADAVELHLEAISELGHDPASDTRADVIDIVAFKGG
jgi:hypothetical protein